MALPRAVIALALAAPLPAQAATIDLAALSAFVPEQLGKARRDNLAAVEVGHVVDGRYHDGAVEIHLNVGTIDDLATARRMYDRDYPTKKASRHMRVHQRHYTESTGRTTSEGCVLIRDLINVCVSVSPSTREADALKYVDAVDLPGLLALAVRSGAPSPFPGSLQFTADADKWREIERNISISGSAQQKQCAPKEAQAKPECIALNKMRADCRPGQFDAGLLDEDIELLPDERANFHRMWLLTCKHMGRPVAER